MNPFQDPDLVAIQRFKADVFVLTKDRIRFTQVGNDSFTYIARLEPRVYQGSIDILEEAVRNKKKLWLIVEIRIDNKSQGGKILYLSDAHYLNDADEIEDINPSKR